MSDQHEHHSNPAGARMLAEHPDETDATDTWYDEVAREELPPRPRRRIVTPVTAGLAAVLLVAVGFIGGVQVQKNQGGSSGAAGGFPRATQAAAGRTGTTGAAGGPGAGGTSSGSITFGTVANKDGETLYVTNSEGTTVKVRLAESGKVTRNATSSMAAVHPGDTVVVQGAASSSGTVEATSVAATASGVRSGLFGGGFGGPPGASSSAGTQQGQGTAFGSG
ncbi:MAG TPA: hypothetical protein VMT10_08920 [Solirubrobacteraceae bacterium]|nr:hypothetical protein [Solirubrobacteraceae bacterium]